MLGYTSPTLGRHPPPPGQTSPPTRADTLPGLTQRILVLNLKFEIKQGSVRLVNQIFSSLFLGEVMPNKGWNFFTYTGSRLQRVRLLEAGFSFLKTNTSDCRQC